MNRKLTIEKLLREGFTEKTLSRLSDKELSTLSSTVLKENTMMIPKDKVQDIEAAKKNKQTFVAYEEKDVNEEKPSSEFSKEKKSKIVKKGEDVEKKVEESVSDVEEWVLDLAESKYSQFTSKKDIMNIISEKMETLNPMPSSKPKKGHNGVPEFMTYDSIIATQPAPAKPDVDTPVKPKTPEKPSKPRTPYQPGPGTDPKPKALAEKKKK
jgi:hypothetical protein